MPKEVLPILGTKDDAFSRTDSIYYFVFVHHSPRWVPAGLSGSSGVLRNGTSWGILCTDFYPHPSHNRAFICDGECSSLPQLFT